MEPVKFASLLHAAKRSAGLLVGLVAVFWLVLALVYAIPPAALEQKGRESACILIDEGLYPVTAAEGATIDNFTAAWMLNIAMHSDGNPFVAALDNAWSGEPAQDQLQRLKSWMEDPAVPAANSYARYWNGYLVYLKPFLLVFGIDQIRLLFQVVFAMALFVAMAVLIGRFGRAGIFLGIALAFSYCIFGALDAVAMLPLFPSFLLSVIGVVWMTRTKLDARVLGRGFLVLGAFTVFFDLLDNPILTLGVPCVVLVFRACRERRGVWAAKILALCALSWLFAYGFVWVMKWVLATIVLGRNVLLDGFDRVAYRTSAVDQLDAAQGWLPLEAIWENLLQGAALPVLIVLCVIVGIAVVACVIRGRCEQGTSRETLLVVGLYLLVGALPFLWYSVAANHSIHHCWFTYRDQIITAFALLACAQYLAFGSRTYMGNVSGSSRAR